jgi:RHS repeat-associated protein
MKDSIRQQTVTPHALHPTRFAFTIVARLLFVLAAGAYTQSTPANGVPLHSGDVIITIDSGSGYYWDNKVKHFSPNGVLLDEFDFGLSNNFLGSLGFDSSNNLYIPIQNTVNNVTKINNNGTMGGVFGSGYTSPASISFDNKGNAYVGEDPVRTSDPATILKFDANGNPLAAYTAQLDPTSGSGVDNTDLAADQCTLRYTSQGESIEQFNVCTGTQLPNLVASLPDPSASPPYELLYGIRSLANGNLLVGTWDNAFLLNSSGGTIRNYQMPRTALTTIALDPDKHTFWAADWSTGNIYRINIQTGAIVSQFNAFDPGSYEGIGSLVVVPMALSTYDPVKNLDKPCNCAGDPINTATGNEYRDDEDISLGALSFHRYYNSQSAVAPSHMGTNWRHSFDRSIEYLAGSNQTTATVFRPGGRQVNFTLTSGQWVADADVADHLVAQTDVSGAVTGWNYFDAATRYKENYDANGNLLSIADTDGLVTTLTYSTATTAANVAPVAGLLLAVTDPRGRALSFTYNPSSEMATVTEPDGSGLTYGYDANGNLTSVTYPDKTSRQYVYNESSLTSNANLPSALTGDIDETGTRFTSIGYNAQEQATMSMVASNIDTTQVTYNTDGTTSTTYPTGAQTTLSFVTPYGSMHTSTASAPCGPQCGQPNAAATFDANGYLASTTDFNGNVTKTTYDTNGLLDQQVDASGTTNQRTTNTTWDTTLRVPLTRTVLDANGTTVAQSAWAYNTRGQPTAACAIDPTVTAAASYTCATTGTPPSGVRRTTYTYCDAVDSTQCPLVGLLLSIDGPRTDVADVTTYAYYVTASATDCGTPGSACHQPGDLYQVTDALGHVTTIASYDGAGRITRLTDANGVNTDLTHTPRGWLASRSVGGATTTIAYTPYGAVASVTDPDHVTTRYTYDDAHRLVGMADALGNALHYTLDAAGNTTAETVTGVDNVVRRSLSRSFNTLGQLTQVTDGLSHTIFNAAYADSYDANGNLVHSADALGVQRQQGYDGLNRLVSTLDNYNGTDTLTANTQSAFAYDALDRLQGVSDPDGLATTYDHDGLGNPTGQTSPDTGTTARTFDAAGNVLTRTDARGITATYAYDALNRLTSASYPDSTQNVSYRYDEPDSVTGCSGGHAIGRLTHIVEPSLATSYCYDARGNVVRKHQWVNDHTDVTYYAWSPADRLIRMQYPSGSHFVYTLDGDGRIAAIALQPFGQAVVTVVSGVSYLPFGPVASYTLGNGQTITRSYDANYALTDVVSPALALHFARDAMGNIVALGSAPGATPATQTYRYDPLYRLTGITDASGQAIESYTYNKTGDRLSKTGGVYAAGIYGYEANTHHLTSVGNTARTVDADGNTTASAVGGEAYGFGYNSRNRLRTVQQDGATVGTYAYNALGQRVAKTATLPAATSQRFAYDEASHLVGEYGSTSRDYVWLDDLPIAIADSGSTATINYVHADGLGTPRAVSNSTGTTIWAWPYASNPFGEQQPTSIGGYTLNLRYPGQYFDVETGQMNWGFRTYNSGTGRSLQSDPMGLFGGQWSTYAYGNNSPLNNVDSLGLFLWPWESPIMISGGTSAEQAQVQAAIDQVFSTPRGQQMLNQIEGPWYEHGNPQTLNIDDNGTDEAVLNGGVLDINPDVNIWITTANGKAQASLARIIAHELGHSLMGTRDDGLCRMNNVNQNENPVAQSLGQPLRTAY